MNKIYLKKDIIRYMAKDSGYSQAVCEDVLNSYHHLLLDSVENADRVQDYGFLDISTVYVPPHTYGNPQDNSIKVSVGAKYKIKAKIGTTLKNAVKKVQAKDE